MDKLKIINEIKSFLDGHNDLKYLVNVETRNDSCNATCVIAEPNKPLKIVDVKYLSFMFMKDLTKQKTPIILYQGHTDTYIRSQQIHHGITISELKTGNQKRLLNGYCYKITSTKSYNDIIAYLEKGGCDPFKKVFDSNGQPRRDIKGNIFYPNRELFYSVKTIEQFFISTGSRLYKGFEEYKDVHKLTFDIETTGLRYNSCRVFLIGVRDNRGFETILEATKLDDDESEIELIKSFFKLIIDLKPHVIAGYNSEDFDFDFLLGRAKILKIDLNDFVGLDKTTKINRRGNVSVKFGNTPARYCATEIWGISVIDILHASKRTQAINNEIRSTGLKYISKYEKISKSNRTYIKGEDNFIGKYYAENKMFLIDENNNYILVPEKYQDIAKKLFLLQQIKDKTSVEQYNSQRNTYLDENKSFISWFKAEALPKKLIKFLNGKQLVRQYLLDDLWETEQVDELYNQSSFLLAKMVPTNYQRITTSGTASVWNILMTAWSYENDLAIPYPDDAVGYPGGLVRCFKTGYSERIIKIDYAGLYPAIQLTEDVFPIFDLSGALKMLLLYSTTTRNIYKKIANSTTLNNEEISLLRQIDANLHVRYINNELTTKDRSMSKIKQLPLKILNNSQYGALGSNVSFNWSETDCAARITCVGRLHLRHAVKWFSKYNCIALMAVTDGVNFQIPKKTNINIFNEAEIVYKDEFPIEDMWQYNGKLGISALIEKFNDEVKKDAENIGKQNYISVDDDGEFISCLNLARINYATLSEVKDKKTGQIKEKVKLTGNTLKSKTMPEYIEEFIDKGFELILHGKGKEFVDYYYDYVDDICLMQIPLKKIANKKRLKATVSEYKKRGKDKNGRDKGKQAHMELLIEKRNKIAKELFELHKNEIDVSKVKNIENPDTILKLVSNYMPPEPDPDSIIYFINTGYKKGHADSSIIDDVVTGEKRYASAIIENIDLIENPDMKGTYNAIKYLTAFNKRIESLLVGYDPDVRKKILVKPIKGGDVSKGDIKKEMFTADQLELKSFDMDNFDEAMFLEEPEIDFWNKTAYDPRLIWNEFRTKEDDRIYYEIYESALNYLNDLMTKNDKPRIKSINSNYQSGDLVLIKKSTEYHVAAYNGTFLRIIKENVLIPKSDIEIELDKKRIEREKKTEDYKGNEMSSETERDIYLKNQLEKREKYFEEFKKKYKIPSQLTMQQVFDQIEKSDVAFDDYVNEQNEKEKDEDLENSDAEEDEDF